MRVFQNGNTEVRRGNPSVSHRMALLSVRNIMDVEFYHAPGAQAHKTTRKDIVKLKGYVFSAMQFLIVALTSDQSDREL